MRSYRVLGVVVFGLLQGLIGCHHATTYTVVPRNGLTGGSAKVGDPRSQRSHSSRKPSLRLPAT